MKIVSWNINSIRSRFHCIEWLIKEENPDVILFQETKVMDKDFPENYINNLGYNVKYYGQKSYNGVAIMSKMLIEDVNYGLIDDPDARYMDAFIGGFRIASVYVPNGRSVDDPHYIYKQNFYSMLHERLGNIINNNEKLVIGGDFNVAPTDNDIWNPELYVGHVACTSAERSWLTDLKSLGLTDVLDKNNHEKNDFTWWDYRAGGLQKDKGWRIDYFLLCKNSMKNFHSGGVLKYIRMGEKPSDHAPIVCNLH